MKSLLNWFELFHERIGVSAMRPGLRILVIILSVFSMAQVSAQIQPGLRKAFQSPPPSASPWVFWYWYEAAVSKEGITADLEAMKEAGIGGAYLMPIKGPANPPLIDSVVVQLSPQWWGMINFAFNEARRLGIKLAIHLSDGFALAGGPWITPELSMQKVVWTQKNISGGKKFNEVLQQPETIENFYKDIAVFAFPSMKGAAISTRTTRPKITSSKNDSVAQLLVDPTNKKNFSSDEPCWIQYEFDQPFTCRSIVIHTKNNYQGNRLIVQTSSNGKTFSTLTRLDPPRHGWQDWDADYTHTIPAATAKYFRFVYNNEGSEPGAEDLDAAKWKQSLKLSGIELSGEARIDEFEGKNGEVWRISKSTSSTQLPGNICVPSNKIIDLTEKIDKNGKLTWEAPPGEWTIVRIGHSSTGHQNETAGGGKGLECDKFNPAAVTLQFDKWFGEFYNHVDPAAIKQVLQFLHVDSWECGSQNWSPVFRNEFKKRRGYDLYPYLLVMTGIPVGSADSSERILHDVRQTIAELVNDNFYVTLAKLAHQKGVRFTAESVAPTMESDGMLHYKSVDVPMGEFWLRSPTHDKPNDMLDAISAAHIYGKNIVQAEGFTELRMAWDEYPGMLKTLADRNFALGINRLVYHVFMHNPWTDKKPGITLDPIGLYFQRDQTWWKQAKAWVDYAKRCQALLQFGKSVTDIAVFTGDEYPRRSVLPDRLVPVLPGIFGQEIVEREQKRLKNEGQPLQHIPAGVTSSANITDAKDWIDPLHGYAYDSYNADALLDLSKVENGNIRLSTGPKYRLLILPGTTKMSPNKGMVSAKTALQIRRFAEAGATILLNDEFSRSCGLLNAKANDLAVEKINKTIFHSGTATQRDLVKIGKGRIVFGPYYRESFSSLGLEPDFTAAGQNGERAVGIAWTHREGSGVDIYFISNQEDSAQSINLSLRVTGKIPEIWNPVTGEILTAKQWQSKNGRTELPVF
ncbi:MAG: glycosyl hydrolase, partial [Flavisolibacter sp.]